MWYENAKSTSFTFMFVFMEPTSYAWVPHRLYRLVPTYCKWSKTGHCMGRPGLGTRLPTFHTLCMWCHTNELRMVCARLQFRIFFRSISTVFSIFHTAFFFEAVCFQAQLYSSPLHAPWGKAGSKPCIDACKGSEIIKFYCWHHSSQHNYQLFICFHIRHIVYI